LSAHRFRTSSFYPKPGYARGVQIDIDAARDRPCATPLKSAIVADSREALRALLPLLAQK